MRWSLETEISKIGATMRRDNNKADNRWTDTRRKGRAKKRDRAAKARHQRTRKKPVKEKGLEEKAKKSTTVEKKGDQGNLPKKKTAATDPKKRKAPRGRTVRERSAITRSNASQRHLWCCVHEEDGNSFWCDPVKSGNLPASADRGIVEEETGEGEEADGDCATLVVFTSESNKLAACCKIFVLPFTWCLTEVVRRKRRNNGGLTKRQERKGLWNMFQNTTRECIWTLKLYPQSCFGDRLNCNETEN